MAAELTPMMKQYHAMRQTLPADVLLLFRLGDFYEMFFEDAKVAAEILLETRATLRPSASSFLASESERDITRNSNPQLPNHEANVKTTKEAP